MTDLWGGAFSTGADTPFVCGTGGWNGPKPGDPDNNVQLTAVSSFGGIDVTWTMPLTNAFALAHTVIYRSETRNFAGAIPIATVAGNFYFDRVSTESPLDYSYWIQLVSINGTYGAIIGPATASTRSRIADTIAELSGRIDQGALATSLRSKVDTIDTLGNNLTAEIQDRLNADRGIGLVIDGVQQTAQRAITLVQQEVINRTTGDAAIVGQINTLAAAYDDKFAAIIDTQTALTTADSALASDIGLLFTKNAGVTAGIANIESAKIGYAVLKGTTAPFDGDRVTVIYPIADFPTASYPQYAADRTRIIDKVGVDRWNLTTVGKVKPAAWLVGLPLATAVKSVGITGPDGQSATVEQAFLAQKDLNNQFKAQYTVKLSVDQNGKKLVGGFGIYGDATGIEAGFDVNRFWIGSSTVGSINPFIVDGGTVYINDAAIKNLSINKLRSDDGSLVFENGKLKANFIQVDKIMSPTFTRYGWPLTWDSSQSKYHEGFYLGPGGLLLGNYWNNRYFQVDQNGNVFAPNFKIENGVVIANDIIITRRTAVKTGVWTGAVALPRSLDESAGTYSFGSIVIDIDTGIDDFIAVSDSNRPLYSVKTMVDGSHFWYSGGAPSGKVYDVTCRAELITSVAHFPTGVSGANTGRFVIRVHVSVVNVTSRVYIQTLNITRINWSLNKVT